MKEFACAALLWVLAGIAVALICAASGGRKDGADKAYDERIAVGAALGLLFGVITINGRDLWEDHALGIAIGPLWGMAIAAMDGRSRPKEKK